MTTGLSPENKALYGRLENEMLILQADHDKSKRRSEELAVEVRQISKKLQSLEAESEAKATEKRALDANVGVLEEEIAHLRRKMNSL